MDDLITPISILVGIVYGAGRVRAAIDELRKAVDRLDMAVRAMITGWSHIRSAA